MKNNNNKYTIDFYEILGIDNKNAPTSEIRKKYINLVAKYHPDKSKDADPQIFALIQRAWECLGNETKRKQYDSILMLEQNAKNSDNLKSGFNKYMELNKNNVNDKNVIKKAENDFNLLFNEMDKKNHFNRKIFKDKGLDTAETSDKYNNLMLEREQQEIEFTQSRLFPEGTKTDNNTLKKFNKIFDEYKNKNEKQQKKHIIEQNINGPSAWNSVFNEQNFTSLDKFDKLYNENDNNINYGNLNGVSYGNLNEFGNEIKLNDLDSDSDSDSNSNSDLDLDDNNFNNNSKNNINYKNDIEKKLKERELDNNTIKSHFDFNNLDQDNTYMFTNNINKDILGENYKYDDDEELQKACNRLLELEK